MKMTTHMASSFSHDGRLLSGRMSHYAVMLLETSFLDHHTTTMLLLHVKPSDTIDIYLTQYLNQ